MFTAILAVLILFCSVFVLMEAGRYAGVRKRKADPGALKSGLSAIEGAVFGLMGLLIAFTFSGAADRFQARRHLIVQEANYIGTAYLRLDLLPASAQAELRNDFRDYLEARIAFYHNLPRISGEQYRAASERVANLQQRIWTEAVKACEKVQSPATTTLVLGAMNDMFDITTTRTFAREDHPPAVIFWGLGILVLAGALLAGFAISEASHPSRLHMLVFSLILAATVYVILDLEFPRSGLIRIDKADHLLTDLRDSMK
jgi:hypothetical protein